MQRRVITAGVQWGLRDNFLFFSVCFFFSFFFVCFFSLCVFSSIFSPFVLFICFTSSFFLRLFFFVYFFSCILFFCFFLYFFPVSVSFFFFFFLFFNPKLFPYSQRKQKTQPYYPNPEGAVIEFKQNGSNSTHNYLIHWSRTESSWLTWPPLSCHLSTWLKVSSAYTACACACVCACRSMHGRRSSKRENKTRKKTRNKKHI